METAYSPSNWIDTALWIWFALTAVSVAYVAWEDRKSTRLNSSHLRLSRMPSSA